MQIMGKGARKGKKSWHKKFEMREKGAEYAHKLVLGM
jgi:hypothetical protein